MISPTIAIVGASADRTKFGNKAIRAYVHAGWRVFPVHPTAENIEGLSVFHSTADVPVEQLDRVSVYLPEAIALTALEGIAARPIAEIWLNPGADGPAVVAKARQLGLNVICGCSILAVGVSPEDLD